MPTYRLIHPETGEVKDHLCSIADYLVLKQEGYVQMFEASKIISGRDHSGNAGGHGTSDAWKDRLRTIRDNNPGSTIDV